MSCILFDNNRERLLPFTHTRPVADIRCGILTMRERWEKWLQEPTYTITASHITPLYPTAPLAGCHTYINGGVVATEAMAQAIASLADGQKLMIGDTIAAFKTTAAIYSPEDIATAAATIAAATDIAGTIVKNVWDIFAMNDQVLRGDYALLTAGRTSAPVPDGVIVKGDLLFIEEGGTVQPGCIINTTTGPVYIGKDAEMMEGTIARGPLAICDHAATKMGAKIYGATTIGPGCKVGGEVSNVVFFANSNKGHDGFLGNAVIGEWCNIGADTNASNLKNNYDLIKIWDEGTNRNMRTGLTFCGLLMGDHSKCGINTMFNTGTVVGVSCNVYGGNFPHKFIPSFSWGGSEGFIKYDFDKAMDTANRMMGRRGKQLSNEERHMYKHIFEQAMAARQ